MADEKSEINVDSILENMNETVKQATKDADVSTEGFEKDKQEDLGDSGPTSGETEEKADEEHGEEPQEEGQKRQLTEIDCKAIVKGWLPKDLYEQVHGTGENWWPADIFLVRNEKAEEVKRLKKQVEDLEGKLHHTQKTTNETVLTNLEQQKRDAIMESDVDKVAEYDKQIQKLRNQDGETESVSRESLEKQSGEEFATRNNAWFNDSSYQNREMKQWAINQDMIMASSKEFSHLHPRDRLSIIEKEVKERFTENFENKAKPRVARVESAASPSSNRKSTLNNVDPVVQDIMGGFSDMMGGELDKEEYLKELKKGGYT